MAAIWMTLELIVHVIMKTCPCNIQRFFSAVKFENFTRQKKKKDIFNILAQNIDCGYTLEPLEPPRRGGSNEYTQSLC